MSSFADDLRFLEQISERAAAEVREQQEQRVLQDLQRQTENSIQYALRVRAYKHECSERVTMQRIQAEEEDAETFLRDAHDALVPRVGDSVVVFLRDDKTDRVRASGDIDANGVCLLRSTMIPIEDVPRLGVFVRGRPLASFVNATARYIGSYDERGSFASIEIYLDYYKVVLSASIGPLRDTVSAGDAAALLCTMTGFDAPLTSLLKALSPDTWVSFDFASFPTIVGAWDTFNGE